MVMRKIRFRLSTMNRGQLFHERGAVCVGLAHDLRIPSFAAARSFSIAASGRICTTSPSVHSSRRQIRTSTSSDTGSFLDSLASVLELMPTSRATPFGPAPVDEQLEQVVVGYAHGSTPFLAFFASIIAEPSLPDK